MKCKDATRCSAAALAWSRSTCLAPVNLPSKPMLVVNGEKDSQVPISDLYMLMQSGGSAKWSWVNPNGGHTGRSQEWPNSRIAEEVITAWVKARLEPASENKQARKGD